MLIEPNCSKRECIHYRGPDINDDGEEWHVCDAFPKGIPDEIAYGENLHLKPFPGDNGIQYERDKDAGNIETGSEA